MRNFRHLHLLFLLLRPSSPNPTVFTLPCCPFCYSLPCRNQMHPHHKKTCIQIKVINKNITINSYVFILSSYGGGGGIRTPVQNTFLFTSYSNITPVFINKLIQFWQIFFLVFHKYLCDFFFGCNRNHNLIDW